MTKWIRLCWLYQNMFVRIVWSCEWTNYQIWNKSQWKNIKPERRISSRVKSDPIRNIGIIADAGGWQNEKDLSKS